MLQQYYRVLSQPQFYMKLADRIYQLPTEEVSDQDIGDMV